MAAAKALLSAAGLLKPKTKGIATKHSKSGSTATEHAASPALTAKEHAASSSQSGSTATEHATEDVPRQPLPGFPKSKSKPQSTATEHASEDAFFLGDNDLEKIVAEVGSPKQCRFRCFRTCNEPMAFRPSGGYVTCFELHPERQCAKRTEGHMIHRCWEHAG